ncbi:hypothetical protein HPB49_007599 [Dermacentor silvarum]|uniref:Uncharacterized protein n=1 Tax=Dermacentor silvarum TaxID=543639 RepID=A0ACB8CDS5_DERSI|nr:hypothetical protein HPB49_007599 [Dermacentor silvarum]
MAPPTRVSPTVPLQLNETAAADADVSVAPQPTCHCPSHSEAAGDRPTRAPVAGNTTTPAPRPPVTSPDSRDAVIALLSAALACAIERCSYASQRAPNTAGSDHFPISLCPTKPSRGATCIYAVVRWPLFRELCASHPRTTDYFAHVADCARRATTHVIVPAGTPCPDIKLLNVRAARRRAQRSAIRSDAPADWTIYNRLDAVCRRHAKQLRRRSWAGLCTSLSDPRNEHRGWRTASASLPSPNSWPTPLPPPLPIPHPAPLRSQSTLSTWLCSCEEGSNHPTRRQSQACATT